MIFTTQSGSAYELDTSAKRIRRISGVSDPTPRQGDDWRAYVDISEVTVGRSVFICWDPGTTPLLPGSPACAKPATETSPVESIYS